MREGREPLYAIITWLIILILIGPIVYMVIMSLKKPLELFSTLFVFTPTSSNYSDLFQRIQLGEYFINSFIIATCTTIVTLSVGSLAAYSFARYCFAGRKVLLFGILFLRMMPPIAAILPLFLIMKGWKLTDTYPGLIWLYVALQTPFVIWMLRGFFIAIPKELEEAAMVDGCTRFQALLKIIVPLSAPGLAATGIFSFTLTWNEFLIALIFTGWNTKTIPVAIPELIGEMGIYWGQICAAGTCTLIPVFIFCYFSQKNLVRGLTFGAVKG